MENSVSPTMILKQTITNHVVVAGRHYTTTWKTDADQTYAVVWCRIKGEDKFQGFWNVTKRKRLDSHGE